MTEHQENPRTKDNKDLDTNNYNQILTDIRSILQKGISKAYKAVDNLKVQTYWQIGERIVREELNHKDRANYGKGLIKKLSSDLNIHERTLYRILKFYNVYPILTTVLSELSWSHYVVLIDIDIVKIRRFYEIKTVDECWSVRELKKRIAENAYETSLNKKEICLQQNKKQLTKKDIFKNTYNWDFITLEASHTEKELECALIDNIQKTLLELGAGFVFLGRQQKILINDNWHKVDLLFYHIILKCYIIVELKARALIQGDIEQVTKYLTYFREQKNTNDRDLIALIVCKKQDTIDVYYSAGKNKDDIFVAEYKTRLPEAEIIKSHLTKNQER
ncbi:MAG: DUF1016 family protein [Nanohaloarchaea archaeon]|nr:DUF1016 family protein [Candidatus Nanohaloarchaea archaeon]